MNISIKNIVAVALLQVGLVSAQSVQPHLKTWSVGARVEHQYDLPSYMFDSELGRDMKGLNGDYTSFDLGYNIYLEKQFTPLLGLQLGFRSGGLTGANDVEYYNNDFFVGSADLTFNLGNLDKRRPNARWDYYAKLGLGRGKYEAHRYLISDQSPNGREARRYWEGHAGVGVQYELNSFLRLELDVTYNMAFDDGFDGYNYSTGNDAYLSTGLGIAYTIGKKEDKPMYSVNFFGEEYFGVMPVGSEANVAPPMDQTPKADSATVARLAKELEELKAALVGMKEVMDQQRETIARLEKENARQKEELAIKLQSKSPEPVKVKQPLKTNETRVDRNKPLQKSVFFEFDSDVLTEEAKQELNKSLNGVQGPITLIGYTDSKGTSEYNAKLKARRAASVRKYLTQVVGIDGRFITTKLAKGLDAVEDDEFNRKVVVQYTSWTSLSDTNVTQN